MKKFALLISLLLTIIVAFSAANAATLAVVGQSDVEAMPDTATLMFNVTTKNKDGSIAQSENVAITRKLIEKLAKAGVKAADVRTSNYFFRREEKNDNNGNLIALGFSASNAIEVKTSNFSLLPQLVAVAVASGATSASDATYSLSDEKPIKDKARTLAFKSADEEATKSANAAGLKLGPITKVAVGAAAISNLLDGLGGGMSRNNLQLDTSNLQPNLTVEMVHVTYSVTIEYELK